MTLLIISFLLAIGFSFLCSILEAVLLSITPSYINKKKREKSSIADDLIKFKEDIDRPLAGILTLNTIAHTLGAIGVGAQAAKVVEELHPVNLFGLVELSWESIIASVMTLCILIISEIIPKTIGANNWKTLAPMTVRLLKIMNVLLFPFIWISQFITKRFKKEKEKSILTRTDFLAMADVIVEGGELGHEDSKIIKNVLQWDGITARKIMTPRTVLFATPESETMKEFHAAHSDLRYSRILVYDNDVDGINGYVLKDEILETIIEGKGDQPLSSIKRTILEFPETKHIDDIFNNLMSHKEHISLIVDEFGGVAGIVTLEDIMETLLGKEIVDEYDNIADMQKEALKKGKERLKK